MFSIECFNHQYVGSDMTRLLGATQNFGYWLILVFAQNNLGNFILETKEKKTSAKLTQEMNW